MDSARNNDSCSQTIINFEGGFSEILFLPRLFYWKLLLLRETVLLETVTVT